MTDIRKPVLGQLTLLEDYVSAAFKAAHCLQCGVSEDLSAFQKSGAIDLYPAEELELDEEWPSDPKPKDWVGFYLKQMDFWRELQEELRSAKDLDAIRSAVERVMNELSSLEIDILASALYQLSHLQHRIEQAKQVSGISDADRARRGISFTSRPTHIWLKSRHICRKRRKELRQS